MGLFQRKDQFSISKQSFSVGATKTLLFVGLGNPGPEYSGSRHNIGFECMDAFYASRAVGEFSNWVDETKFKAQTSNGNIDGTRVILAKPTTYMNLSGESVELILNYFKIPVNNTIVVYDDLDINFGQIKTSIGGSSAGHNGVQSIIDKVGDNFIRLRVGIGPKTPPQIDGADFVLAKFSDTEQSQLTNLRQEVSANLTELIYNPSPQTEVRSFLV